jgi:hypothetical protein
MAAILFARPFPVTSFPGAGSRSGALVEHFRNISRSVVNGDAVLWSRKVIVFLVKYHMSYFEFLRISLIPRVKKRRPIQALRCVNTCAEAAVGVSVKHTHTQTHTEHSSTKGGGEGGGCRENRCIEMAAAFIDFHGAAKSYYA